MGMAYLSALVTVGHCFEKKRALATGIAVCGSGVGGFVMAPLLEYLLYKYSWKGAMWIISGISLNCAVMGALFCPIKVVDKHGSATEENSKCCDVSKTLSACASMFEISLLRRFTFLEYSFSCFLCLISKYYTHTLLKQHFSLI